MMDRYHLLTLGGLLVECGKNCADRALAERLEALGSSLRELHRPRRYAATDEELAAEAAELAASLRGLATEAAELTGFMGAVRRRRGELLAAATGRPTAHEGGIA